MAQHRGGLLGHTLSVSVGDVVIREAVEADAGEMGRLHVRAWQVAYRGIMPDEYLDGLRPEDRIEMWRGHLSRADRSPVLVAVRSGSVVGFAAFGPEAAPEPSGSCGELYAVNLDPDSWGQGIGRLLLRRSTEALVAMGFREAVLWVLPENDRARSLYESEGWVPDGGVSTDDVMGVTVTDIRYRTLFPAVRGGRPSSSY